MPPTPQPPRTPIPADAARWLSDLHCLWRFCEKRHCQRAQGCRGALSHCLPFISLLPPEACEFIRHWDDALREGLSFDEMMDEHAEQWQALTQWRDRVAATLPQNRRMADGAWDAEAPLQRGAARAI